MATARHYSSPSGRARVLTPPPVEKGEPGEFNVSYGYVCKGMRLLFEGWSADVQDAETHNGWIYLNVCAASVGQVVTVRRRPDQLVKAEWIPPEPEPIDDIFTL